jgi:hypothetical protein
MSEQVEWTGGSGRTYTFVVVPWPAPLDFGVVDGNYICARQTKNGEWIPVYIGEGDLAAPCVESHPSFEQLVELDVTHFHCHINDDPASRRREAHDLLSGHALALMPTGCNEPLEARGRMLRFPAATRTQNGSRARASKQVRRRK